MKLTKPKNVFQSTTKTRHSTHLDFSNSWLQLVHTYVNTQNSLYKQEMKKKTSLLHRIYNAFIEITLHIESFCDEMLLYDEHRKANQFYTYNKHKLTQI